ncbi:putative leo1-like protein [Helianthus anomalus]
MPSSITSNSHRLSTALVDSQHKKVFRVKKIVTDIDPEREKEQKEKFIAHDYQDDEQDYYDSWRSGARRHFEEDLEMEARAENRIINAKKSQGYKDTRGKSSLHAMVSFRRPIDDYESEREESDYEEKPRVRKTRGLRHVGQVM